MKWRKFLAPREVAISLSNKKIFRLIPDKQYLKFKYWLVMDKKLDIDNPKTYNEKIQWLKLNDRELRYSKLVDKYDVREYVKEKISDRYLIPLYGVYNTFDEIDFEKLPNSFVLKTTHDSGGVVICKDKDELDLLKAKKKLEKSLRQNYFWRKREWPYKNVQPRIIAEKYMVDESGFELKDYKFFCFDGHPEFMFIASGRSAGKTKFDFFDMDFNNIPVRQHYDRSDKPSLIVKPESFEDMKMLAAKLSHGMKHLRIDFYSINGDIYFGEITFYHFSGTERFEPETFDKVFGDLLELK